MDSTSIAAKAQKVILERGKPCDFQAFTMRDRLMMPEEDSYACMVAHFIGIPLNEMNCEEYMCRVPSVNPQTPLPEPIGISDRNPGNDFTRRCADHARIILTGFGGDPGLRFGEFYWLEWWKHGLRRESLQVLGHYLNTHRSTKLYLRQGMAYWRKITKQQLGFPTWFNSDFVKELTKTCHYQIYGITLRSNQALPILIPVSTTSTTTADLEVSITECELLRQDSKEENNHHPSSWYTQQKADGIYYCLSLRGSKERLDVEIAATGKQIWINWVNLPLAEVTAILIGCIMGKALRLQGKICLHSSVIAVDGSAFSASQQRFAIAIIGAKSAGKSTTAAALAKRGYPTHPFRGRLEDVVGLKSMYLVAC
jgi:hypothetical protein